MNTHKPLDEKTPPSTSDRLLDMLELLDDLHSAASDGNTTMTDMSAHDLTNLLRDMIYVAEQTIHEVQAHSKRTPRLCVLPKPGQKKIG